MRLGRKKMGRNAYQEGKCEGLEVIGLSFPLIPLFFRNLRINTVLWPGFKLLLKEGSIISFYLS